MKKLFLIISMLFLAAGCGKIDNGSSSTPDPTLSVKAIGITSDKTSVTSTGLDKAVLTVRTLGTGNGLVSGATVNLSASSGALSSNIVETDASGQATVTFDSGLDISNQSVIITASSGKSVDTVTVNIIGTTVAFTASQNSVLLNGGNTATLTATAKDANDQPLPNIQLTMSSSGLGTLTNLRTSQSGNSITLITDAQGQGKARYSAGDSPGVDTIQLSGPAGENSLEISVTSSVFSLTDDTQGLPVNLGAQNVHATLTWIDASGAPVTNQSVTFSANQGKFSNNQTSLSATTNSAGQATVIFTPSVAGPAIIIAHDVSSSFSTALTLNVQAINPSSVSLQVSPSVVGRADDSGIPTATLTATVRDASNNVVANQDVTFSILTGPGGGERVEPVVARTNAGGIATSTFYSGGQTSAQKGVVLKASLSSHPSTSGTATLTIGQQAARIDFGTTNKISKLSVNGLDIAYALPITVLVTDNNGNPIPNQTVSLGLYPLKFLTGSYVNSSDPTSIITGKVYDNEDVNRNGILDPGEDGGTGYRGEDLNGNGILDTRINEDLNGNAILDTCWDEDLNNNGVLDTSINEDLNGNDSLDTNLTEDFNGNGRLDLNISEDLNINGILDLGEDFNNNGVLDAHISEDLNGDGKLETDLNEDLNGNGLLDTALSEDINHNGLLDSCVNEDLNGNGMLDTKLSEDLNHNGVLDSLNGHLDPGNIAAIPSEVITDANGFAGFNITYAKSYGNWVKVEISASTTVSGNLATARIVVALSVMEGDTPYLPSPFNPIPE